jgi:tRNA(His) 5'-end guanylyltransferase
VILRLDGRSFHTLTKEFEKPFDDVFRGYMFNAMEALITEVQGAVIGYTQSDEISLCLWDWETFETQPWFDNRVQKLCSIAASIATCEFAHQLPMDKDVAFDCRAFNVPADEVCNYFVWRQQDAIRNYWQAMGQYHVGKKKILGMSNASLKELLKETQPGVIHPEGHAYRIGMTLINREGFEPPHPFLFAEQQYFIEDLLKGQE